MYRHGNPADRRGHPMTRRRRIGPVLGVGALVIAIGGAAVSADTAQLAAWSDRLTADAAPQALAQAFPAAALTDLQGLNALRLRLKADGKAALAQPFFAALAAREPSDAVLLNLSLADVDQLMGKSLYQQGKLSSRSQETVARIIGRTPDHWTAWYIRGLNNLYWPDWFRKAKPARDYLTEAVAIHTRLAPLEQDENDQYALGYLALGDAYALLDQPAVARRTWEQGLLAYPYVAVLRERLQIPDGDQHAAVRARRDVDRPIDTDLAFLWSHGSAPFRITLTGGTLYGPGPLDDQSLDPGGLANLYLGSALNGFIPAANNGAAEPNLPGEVRQGKVIDGLLSDGTPANENIDVGFVSLMNGKFNLFLAAVADGPNQGRIHFFLDDGWHWTIRDDIGIDPGFAVGVIKIQEFTFSTSPRVLPQSLQTQAGNPGGVDRAGSIASGAVVPGALGDADFDGRLDGIMNAIGRFPYDSVILPGVPFAQTRLFNTDIPITAAQAALLTLANALAHLRLALDLQDADPARAAVLRGTFNERLETARRHAQGSALSAAAGALLTGLGPNADAATLCDAWTMLRAEAPANGLRQREFNASGIKIACVK